MKTVITLDNQKRIALPPEFGNDDVRYTEELVETFLNEYTKEHDIVFDPFLGFGTTMVVCERLNRICYGVEFDSKRLGYVKTLVRDPSRAMHGDSTKLSDLDLPAIDFCITSPPYMGKHHKENPFTAYSTLGQGYTHYLDTLQSIYKQINKKMKPDGRIVVEVSNLKDREDDSRTTLAWDISDKLSSVLDFDGEIIVNWVGGYGYGYDHSYCLIFRAKS